MDLGTIKKKGEKKGDGSTRESEPYFPLSSSHKEIQGLICLGISLLCFLSLFSFHAEAALQNWLGLFGHGLSFALIYLFGVNAFLLSAFFGWIGWHLLLQKEPAVLRGKIISFTLFLITSGLLWNLFAENWGISSPLIQSKIYSETILFEFPYPHHKTRHNVGGVPLYFLYRDIPTFNLQTLLGDLGVGIIFFGASIISILLFTELRLFPLLQAASQGIKSGFFLAAREVQKWLSPALPRDLEAIAEFSPDEIERSLTRAVCPKIGARHPAPPSRNSLLPSTSSPHSSMHLPSREMENLKEVEVELTSLEKKGEGVGESVLAKWQKKASLLLPKTPPLSEEKQSSFDQVLGGGGSLIKKSLKNLMGNRSYEIPPPSLLTHAKKVDMPTLKKDLRKQAEILEETLLSFGIEAKVGEIHCGPTIVSFEVHPSIGVKVQKIKAVENDIALNLQAKSIRIIAPIPGKAAVGVEIPSPCPQEVSFKEMLIQYQQSNKRHFIPVILGKTVSGESVLADLAKMPHCIIAGATGSGKSVCINTLVMSILMTATPDEIKLLLVDPKKVELAPYAHLPHMIAPVITEAHGAYAALHWLVKEMELRYEILKQLGVRNITAFNNRKIHYEFEQSLSLPIPEKMYAIVAIIDEFADLMMVSSSDLETPIARIAQMARAVGIHLVLATQRPSREVITGLIKANFPTRIAFKVASRINSQIILDETGAESLLGNGDMLFLPPGSSQLIRAQGAYIRDEDIHKVVSFICDQLPPNYLIESFDTMRKEQFSLETEEESPKDSLYEQALQIVIDTQTASTTFLQRKLKIGYARAASLMDELEQKGVIASQEGSKPRRILMKEVLKEKKEL